MVSDGSLEGDHAVSTEGVLPVHVEVPLGVAWRTLPLSANLATFEAGCGSDEEAENDQGAAADHHVQDRDAELEGAVCLFFVES